MYVLITGNPIDGISLIGPFDEPDAAIDYAEVNINGQGEWWLVEVEAPQEQEQEQEQEG
jgi:hypothetical protein